MKSREPVMLVGTAIYLLERAFAYTEETRDVYLQLALDALRRAERLLIEEHHYEPPKPKAEQVENTE